MPEITNAHLEETEKRKEFNKLAQAIGNQTRVVESLQAVCSMHIQAERAIDSKTEQDERTRASKILERQKGNRTDDPNRWIYEEIQEDLDSVNDMWAQTMKTENDELEHLWNEEYFEESLPDVPSKDGIPKGEGEPVNVAFQLGFGDM